MQEFLPFGFVLLFLPLVVGAHVLMARKRRRLFEALAPRLGGTLPPLDPWLRTLGSSTNAMLFRIGDQGRFATLQIRQGQGKNAPTYTEFLAPTAPTSRFQLFVRQQNLLDSLGGLMGLQDIRVGNPAFDREFVIKSTDESRAASFLSQLDVQKWILDLKSLAGAGGVEVRLDAEGFAVRSAKPIEKEESLASFARSAAALYAKLPDGLPYPLRVG